MQYAYINQSNEVSLPLVAKATGDAITSGTINFYLKDIDSGKWFRGSDGTFQTSEALAGEATHETDGHWILTVASAAWLTNHRYRLYAKITGSTQISVGDSIIAVDMSGSTSSPLVPEGVSGIIDPLYNTKAGLLNRIRMATVSDPQVLSVVNMAITEVRLAFYNALGSSRALEIAAYTASDTPTTTEQILKGIAQVAEALWVTALLVDQLPYMVLDNSSNVRDEFNDEPLTRDSRAIAKYKDNLMSRINKMLGKLENPENAYAGDFQVFSCGAVDADGESAPYLINDNFVGKKL